MNSRQWFAQARVIWTTVLLVMCAVVLDRVLPAQTATSGTIVGTVTDATGAVVPNAEVELVNVDTNATATQKTNSAGQYVFLNLPPGDYKITVKMTGFRTASVPNVRAEVNQTYTLPISLEVGAESQVIEVTATSSIQLQTTDSQIGNVLSHDALLRLPTLQRSVTELVGLQPGVVPSAGGSGSGIQMRVTGAIDDQNAITLDGIDVTQGVVAANTVIPIPPDSVEEFRVNVANPNANSARASGGQVAFVGRTGGNTLHGSGYSYFQNSILNSNTWDNNRAGIAKPDIDDKRFGGSVGGPIVKDKTFFFGMYEGRRFDSVAQITRTVPTDSFKAGILKFRDAAGNVQSFDLKTSAFCGPNGNTACDPRGLGISPSVKAQLDKMPASNLSGGDGLNTNGFLANIAAPTQEDFGVLRLNHSFSEKLTFSGSYTYYRRITTGAANPANSQVSIINGNSVAAQTAPQRGVVVVSALTWQIHPTLLNTFRFGYVKDTNAGQATPPSVGAGILNTPGSNTAAGPIALLIGSGVSSFLDEPIDMDTQRARYQENWNKDFQFIDDMSWIHGSHTMQYGVQFHSLPYTHARADKVVGSLSSLAANIDANSGLLTIPAINRPPTCGGSITSNCLRSSDTTNWNRYYAAALGMVDSVSILAIRDSKLAPTPFGNNLVNHTQEYATYLYWMDTWRLTRSLTLTYGLSYGWQTAPTEDLGQQTVQIDTGSGQLMTGSFMQTKEQAALQGQVYNPTIGWVPVRTANKPVYKIDWGDVAPRGSFAWNPSFNNGFVGRVFGDRKTVLRGGFAMVYDRSNIVQNVLIPMLGVGFGQTISVNNPLCNASGAAGAGCNASAGAGNSGSSAYRVGVDGPIPLPPFGAATSPVVPAVPFGETLSFQVDPNTKVGRSYAVDLSIQRELPGNMLFDVAYVGRFARRLPQAVNFTNAPYMYVDSASGQSFAKAFDNIATALRGGQSAATIPAQPWFENQLAGLPAKVNFSGTPTAYVLQQLGPQFQNGNVSNIFLSLGAYRRQLGLPTYNNEESQLEFMRTYIGQSNYNGLLLSLNKRLSHGLSGGVNYTFSRTLDDNLSNQNNAGYYTNGYHPGVDYGPSNFDRTHVFNAYYVYDFPAGKGHRLSTGNWFDRVLGGWSTSGIVTYWTGVPLLFVESGQVWGDGPTITTNSGMIPVNGVPETGMHDNVAGSNGYGTTSAASKNLFANPEAAFKSFRPVLLGQDTRTGRANPIRGLPYKNMDISFSKRTQITERFAARFSADFFNVFNHPNFANPAAAGLSYTNQAAFGAITQTYVPPGRTNSARWIELGIRVDF